MAGRGNYGATGFGQRLRAVREAKGMTQQQLADAAGSHKNTVARLERGEQEPAWPLVLAFARALEVDCTAFEADGTPGVTPEPTPIEPTRRGRPRNAPGRSDAAASPEPPPRVLGKRK